MESNPKNDFKVGVFTFIGLALLGLSIFLIGGDRFLFRSQYQLKGTFEDIQGLDKGSEVSLAGIIVGNITKIAFSESDNEIIVYMDIDREYQKRITKGSTVGIKTKGALGDRYLYISPGPINAQPLEENSVIAVEKGADLFEQGEKGLNRAVDVIDEMYVLLKSINKDDRSALTMANIHESSQNLKGLIVEAHKLLKDIRGKNQDQGLQNAIENLSSLTQKLDDGKGTLGALINDPSLYNKLVQILGGSPRNQYLKPLIRNTIKSQED